MNWDDIRIFDAAASMGSLSAGAQAIGMSQPQVSRRLRELEKEIGARLFDRTPQGLRPTAAGAKLIPLAMEMRTAADAISRVKPNLVSEATIVVRISVDEIREHFLLSNLVELRKYLDDVELEIFSGHEHLDHESRMTDIQIRSCLPDNETLIAKRLGSTGYGFYASTDLLNAYKYHSKKSAVKDLPWIGLSPDHLWYPLQKQLLDKTFSSSPALRCNAMTGILQAASNGHGAALLPHFMARNSEKLQLLKAIDVSLETVEYLIVHRDILRENAVRRTVDAITNLYKQKRKSLSYA